MISSLPAYVPLVGSRWTFRTIPSHRHWHLGPDEPARKPEIIFIKMCNLLLAAVGGVVALGSCAMVICVAPSFAKTRGGIVRAIEAMSSCKDVGQDFIDHVSAVAAVATSMAPAFGLIVSAMKYIEHAEKKPGFSLMVEVQLLTQSLLVISWTAFAFGVGWCVGAFLAPILVNGPRVVTAALKFPALGLIEDVATMVRSSPSHEQ